MVFEYVHYHCTRRLGRLSLTERLSSPQQAGLRKALTGAAAATPNKGKFVDPAYATCQQVSPTEKSEFCETASVARKEADSSVPAAAEQSKHFGVSFCHRADSSVPAAAEQSKHFGPSFCHCHVLCRTRRSRQLCRG